MTNQKVIHVLVGVSIGWGIVINILVVLNRPFVLSMAAGGQLLEVPIWLRVIYLMQAFWLAFEGFAYYQSAKGNKFARSWVFLVFTVLNGLGFFLNLFSTSPNERLNAIPLAILTYVFWIQYKKQKAF
ncbi:MAG: hypothetical protein RLZZ508_471 [Actinomycetota bacterium]|jgi:hypothetical protein